MPCTTEKAFQSHVGKDLEGTMALDARKKRTEPPLPQGDSILQRISELGEVGMIASQFVEIETLSEARWKGLSARRLRKSKMTRSLLWQVGKRTSCA